MKKFLGLFMLMLLVFMALVANLSAEKLKYDANGIPIQQSRYFTTVRDTIPAQAPAVYDSLAVPANAAQAVVISRHQAIYVKYGGLDKAVATNWSYIPVNTPIILPTIDAAYLCYKSATGAASLNIIWYRM